MDEQYPSPIIRDILNSSVENIADTSPPADFQHFGVDTPKPKTKSRIKGRGRPFLSKLLNRSTESKTRLGSPDRLSLPSKVTFQEEVESIPIGDQNASNSDSGDDEYVEDEVEDEVDTDWTELDSNEVEQATETDSVTVSEEQSLPKEKSSSSTIATLMKSLVMTDVGPNLADTVQEFSNLLSEVATRTIDQTIRFRQPTTPQKD